MIYFQKQAHITHQTHNTDILFIRSPPHILSEREDNPALVYIYKGLLIIDLGY